MTEPERYYDWMLWKMRQEKNMENTLQKATSMIWVTFKKEGIHKYPHRRSKTSKLAMNMT